MVHVTWGRQLADQKRANKGLASTPSPARHTSPNSPRRLRPTPLLLGRQDGAQLGFFLLTTFFLTLFFLRNVIAYSNWWKR